MKLRLLPLLACLGALACVDLSAEDERPQDRTIRRDQEKLDRLIAPYVEMSRKSYPTAKDRFLAGLPKDHIFLVTVLLQDEKAHTAEQVFLKVDGISGKSITGQIGSDLDLVTNYKKGETITVNENDIRDWTIVAPDGSEEGNLVGKFIDVLHDKRVPFILSMELTPEGKVKSAKFESALNRYKQDVSFCIPEEAKRQAEQMILKMTYDPDPEGKKKFTYLVYNYTEKKIEELKKKAE